MKTTVVSIALLLTLIGLSACAPTHRLESGNYVLSIKQTTSSQTMPKTVSIQVEGQKVTIQNPDHDLVFMGKVEGNAFQAVAKNDSQTVEFQGQLVGQNQVAGKVIQKSDSSVTREAEFTIKKRSPAK